MRIGFVFLFKSVMLGVGLAMDAFSVSMANGLNEPHMKKGKMCEIAGVFAVFQAIMPMTGWFCVHTIARYFKMFEKCIPWIALLLLGFIGGKMLWEGVCRKDEENGHPEVGFLSLLVQGIATSIDALSVGFTIADYNFFMAFTSSLIIAAVTFAVCMCGLVLGKTFGTRLSNKAQILGGVILILIGAEVFISGVC